MNSKLEVINNTLEGYQQIYAELDLLDKKETLTGQEERRRVNLLSKAAALRTGITASELNAATVYKIRKELGISENERASLSIRNEHAVADWHALLSDHEQYRKMVEKREVRANVAGTQSISYTDGALGGYAVPFGYDDRQRALMSRFSSDGIYDLAASFDSLRPIALAQPVVDDIQVSGTSPVVFSVGASVILLENTLDTAQDIQVGAAQWSNTPKWSSGMMRVSFELFEDARYGVENVAALIEAVVASRHVNGFAAAMVTGAGLSGGLIPNLPADNVITSTSSTLSLNDFINLYAALPVRYRKNAAWFMHDNTRLALHKLLETSARPSIELPTQYLGLPIGVCNSMDATAPGVPHVVVIANRDYIQIRRAGSYLLTYRQAPNTAEAGLIGFKGLMFADFQTALFGSQVPPVASMNQHG